MAGELREPVLEEGQDGLFRQFPYRDVLTSAGVRGPSVDQHLHRDRHPPCAVADLAGPTEQSELVEVVVEHGAEPVERVAAVRAGELLRQVVGEGVGVAEPLTFQQDEVGGELTPSLDGDAAVLHGRADSLHGDLLFRRSGYGGQARAFVALMCRTPARQTRSGV